MSLPPPPPPSLPPPSGGALSPAAPGGRPWWKQWWAIAGAAVLGLLVVGGIAAVAGGDDDDDSSVVSGTAAGAPASTEGSTVATSVEAAPAPTGAVETVPTVPDTSAAPDTTGADDTAPESTVPASTAPAADPGIGDTITFDDGGSARINAVTADAPPRSELFPPDPGFTFTEAEVEQCAGSERASANPLYWKAFLTDNTEAEVSILSNDMQSFEMSPGACIRGWIAFSVPEGATLGDIVLTDSLFSEIGRWTTATTVPIAGPLAGPELSAAALGETVELEGGGTAVVRTITPNAPPASEFFPVEPGRQLVDAEVELCAGSESLSVNPLYWLMTAQDNYTGGASLAGGTLATIDVAAGQCVAGTVQLDMLEQSVPAYVILTGALFDEVARWAG